MGLDSTYYPPKKIKRDDLEKFLALLQYEKQPLSKFDRDHNTRWLHYFSKTPYESLQGVSFAIRVTKGELTAHGRNNIWCSNADRQYHDLTLRELKKHFGGYFISDYGKNRYFKKDGPDRDKDESGCFIEAGRAINQIGRLSILTNSIPDPRTPVQKDDLIWMNEVNPHVILGNLAVSYILSVIENYFRNTYVALLTYSEKKSEILKASQIRTTDLLDVSKGDMRIEEAFAHSLNFQNVKSICETFDRLDQQLGIRQAIAKKHGRRKESFQQFIERIANHRHKTMHRNIQDLYYDLDFLKKDVLFCKILILSIYKNIVAKKHWVYEEPW